MFLKIGHRGKPGYPRQGENTIPSFEAALAAGADGVELDVRRSKDGRLVISHDQTMASDAPLLSEVLDKFGGKCFLNIELKESGLAETVKAELLARELSGLPPERCVLVSAFDADDNDQGANSSWEDLLAFPPDFRIGLLAGTEKMKRIGEKEFIQKAVVLGAKAIHPENTAVTPSLVTLAHAMGLLVNVWTVNDPKEIRDLKNMGVDGMISDFPERLGV